MFSFCWRCGGFIASKERSPCSGSNPTPSSPTQKGRPSASLALAEKVGFEPTRRVNVLRDFESRLFGHLSTSPYPCIIPQDFAFCKRILIFFQKISLGHAVGGRKRRLPCFPRSIPPRRNRREGPPCRRPWRGR